MQESPTTPKNERPGWTFLSNHGHVLVCLANDPEIRGRDIAERVGITERAAQAIISDLVADGYVRRTRIGRRNRYEIISDRPLRHPLERHHNVGELAGFARSPMSPTTPGSSTHQS
ncbi:MAG: winged helix-turn-helix domain-containing protein [Acidimicrobiales bacterium]